MPKAATKKQKEVMSLTRLRVERIVLAAMSRGEDPAAACLRAMTSEGRAKRGALVEWMSDMFASKPKSPALCAVALTLAKQWAKD